jgi:hypothetical protein
MRGLPHERFQSVSSMTASNRKRPREPAIVVPKPADEQPRFGRVGAIAAVGFIVGVAWPGLARVELVPQPPVEAALPIPSGPAASLGTPAPDISAEPSHAAPEARKDVGPKVRLADVVNCVDADGRKRQKCDAPALDAVLSIPLKSLLACDGAEGQSGVLSLGFDIDFGSGTLGRFTAGRSTTLDAALTRSLVECAKAKLTHIDVSSVEHGYSSYRIFYVIEFTRASPAPDRPTALPEPAAPSESTTAQSGEAELQGQSGRATVTWDVAIVRKAPKDGAIVARVLGGTRVVVNGRQGDWYRIKYNAKGDEGFVFKSAIGL